MLELLTYDFIRHALIIGIFLSISAALLSPFLVLNEQAMIADGLAHVSFTGLIFGILFIDQPLYLAIPFVVIASLLIKYLATSKTINGDAAIGLISSISFAIGLFIIKKSTGFNISVESMLVGNIFTALKTDMYLAIIITVLILIFILVFYRKLFLMTYDLNYAKFKGIKTNALSYLLAGLTAIFIVIGVRTIGTLLISALVVFPAVISSQLTKSFRYTLIIGVISSLFIVIFGIFLAHPLEAPVGSSIVILYTIFLSVVLFYNKIIKGNK